MNTNKDNGGLFGDATRDQRIEWLTEQLRKETGCDVEELESVLEKSYTPEDVSELFSQWIKTRLRDDGRGFINVFKEQFTRIKQSEIGTKMLKYQVSFTIEAMQKELMDADPVPDKEVEQELTAEERAELKRARFKNADFLLNFGGVLGKDHPAVASVQRNVYKMFRCGKLNIDSTYLELCKAYLQKPIAYTRTLKTSKENRDGCAPVYQKIVAGCLRFIEEVENMEPLDEG